MSPDRKAFLWFTLRASFERFIHTVEVPLLLMLLRLVVVPRLGHRDGARFHAMAIRRRAFERFTAERSTGQWPALYDRLLPDKGDGQ